MYTILYIQIYLYTRDARKFIYRLAARRETKERGGYSLSVMNDIKRCPSVKFMRAHLLPAIYIYIESWRGEGWG